LKSSQVLHLFISTSMLVVCWVWFLCLCPVSPFRMTGGSHEETHHLHSNSLAYSDGPLIANTLIQNSALRREDSRESSHKSAFHRLRRVSRARAQRHESPEEDRMKGPAAFWSSVSFHYAFFVVLALSLLILETTFSAYVNVSVGITWWLLFACCCCATVYRVKGPQVAEDWAAGYLLELIFSLENVFVFNIIHRSCKAPQSAMRNALVITVVCQTTYQAVLFMELAPVLRVFTGLPYLLGSWLIYAGLRVAFEEPNSSAGGGGFFTGAMRVCCASRVSSNFSPCGRSFFVLEHGRWALTMLVPLTATLVFVDLLFELDVTLTKIETFSHEFVNFSSSVVAACAVPDLYHVVSHLQSKYPLLNYAFAFVFLFYGLSLLLHEVYNVPALVGIGVVSGAIFGCATLSEVLKMNESHSGRRSLSDMKKRVDMSSVDCAGGS